MFLTVVQVNIRDLLIRLGIFMIKNKHDVTFIKTRSTGLVHLPGLRDLVPLYTGVQISFNETMNRP